MGNKGFVCNLNITSDIPNSTLDIMASQEFDKLTARLKPKFLDMIKQGHLKYELKLEVLDSLVKKKG